MAYDTQLVDRIREYLVQFQKLEVEEKKMFSWTKMLESILELANSK